jgi:hypothetical protein
MILTLSSKWSEKLIALPETGMGYQRVKVTLKSGKLILGLVVQNAEELQIPDNIESFKEDDIQEINLDK